MDQRHGNISLLRIPRSRPRRRPSHRRPRYRRRHRRVGRRWRSSRSLSPLPSRRSSHLDLNPALQSTSPRHLPPSLWTVVIVVTAIIVDRQKRGKGSPHSRCDDPQPAPRSVSPVAGPRRHLPRRSHGGREANAAALLFFPYPVPPGLNPCLSSASPPPRSTSPAAPHGSKRGNRRSLLRGDGASRAEAAPARAIGPALREPVPSDRQGQQRQGRAW